LGGVAVKTATVRGWRAPHDTAFVSPGGLITIREGDFVLVTIAPSFEQAADIAADEIRKLGKPDNER
jgi:hypothetical protein